MDIYTEASTIIQKVSNKRGSIKNLVYSSKIVYKKALYALVCETMKCEETLRSLLSQCTQLKNDKMLQSDHHLMSVLLYEHLMGRGVRGKFKKTMLRHKNSLHAACERMKIAAGVTDVKLLFQTTQKSVKRLPKYVRVNTIRMSMECVLQLLMAKFTVVSCTKHSLLNQIEDMGQNEVLIDPYMPDLLVFNQQTDLHNHPLYKSGVLILQDKASCLPAFILSPAPSSSVIDCCAAPGNKTTHLAAIMQNEGSIFAFDRDPKRAKVLESMVKRSGADIITVQCKDFLSVDPEDPLYAKVEYVLVDPSCSGSGMVERNIATETDPHESERLQQLAVFQTTILFHALKFPRVQKVTYSTCSVHAVENEQVVEAVLDKVDEKFELENILPDWPCRGLQEYTCGEKCLRLSADLTKTHGFFVACFNRRKTLTGGKCKTGEMVNGGGIIRSSADHTAEDVRDHTNNNNSSASLSNNNNRKISETHFKAKLTRKKSRPKSLLKMGKASQENGRGNIENNDVKSTTSWIVQFRNKHVHCHI